MNIHHEHVNFPKQRTLLEKWNVFLNAHASIIILDKTKTNEKHIFNEHLLTMNVSMFCQIMSCDKTLLWSLKIHKM